MARADLILTLIKASRQGDDGQVRKAVEALAADERAKNHTIWPTACWRSFNLVTAGTCGRHRF